MGTIARWCLACGAPGAPVRHRCRSCLWAIRFAAGVRRSKRTITYLTCHGLRGNFVGFNGRGKASTDRRRERDYGASATGGSLGFFGVIARLIKNRSTLSGSELFHQINETARRSNRETDPPQVRLSITQICSRARSWARKAATSVITLSSVASCKCASSCSRYTYLRLGSGPN